MEAPDATVRQGPKGHETEGPPGGPSSHPARAGAGAVLGGGLVLLGLRRRSLGGAALALAGSWLLYRGARGRPIVPDALLDPGREAGRVGAPREAPEVERSITIGADAQELRRAWLEPSSLPRVMAPFAEVRVEEDGRAHWTVRPGLGRELSWTTRIVEDLPGERLRWVSLEGADLPNEGSLRFRPAPAGRGTVVTLHLRFDPPGGALGGAAAKGLGFVSDTLAGKVLRRFKSLVETGEIPTLARNPAAYHGTHRK